MNHCDNYSVKGHCGDWETPVVEDTGRCFPYREKRTCDAPTIPTVKCADDEWVLIPQPDNPNQPFKIQARIFDQNCDTITDENGNDILTYIA